MNKNIIREFIKLVEQIQNDIDNPPAKISKTDKMSNLFRLKNIKNALNIIKKHNSEILSSSDLDGYKGIGKGIKTRIDEILKNGNLKEIKEKNDNNDTYIKELENIIGIGRKTAYDLVVNKNIKSIDELKNAYNNNIIDLNDNILVGLKYYNVYKQNIPRKEIDSIKKKIIKIVNNIDNNLIIKFCGSYRRKKSMSNDIDILLAHKNIITKIDIKTNINYLHDVINILKQKKFLVDDITHDKYEYKYMGFCKYGNNPIRRIDMRYIPYRSYYSALLYFTGSGEFNAKMRHTAKLLGYKLNEYGLYKINKNKEVTKQMNINSEKEIFDILNMEYLSPEHR